VNIANFTVYVNDTFQNSARWQACVVGYCSIWVFFSVYGHSQFYQR